MVGLIPTPFAGKPARGVGKKKHTNSEKCRRDHRHCEHWSPAHSSSSKGQVYQISHQDTNGNSQLVKGNERPPDGWRCHLSDKHWSNYCRRTDSEPNHNAEDDKKRQIRRDGRQDGSDGKNDCHHNNSQPTTESI